MLIFYTNFLSIDKERNFEKFLLTNLVIYFQFLLLKWRIYFYSRTLLLAFLPLNTLIALCFEVKMH